MKTTSIFNFHTWLWLNRTHNIIIQVPLGDAITVTTFFTIIDEKKIKVGSVSITLTLDTVEAVSELSAHPFNLETFEINIKKSSVAQIDMTLDTTDERSKKTDQSTEYSDYSTNDHQSTGRERIVGTFVEKASDAIEVSLQNSWINQSLVYCRFNGTIRITLCLGWLQYCQTYQNYT